MSTISVSVLFVLLLSISLNVCSFSEGLINESADFTDIFYNRDEFACITVVSKVHFRCSFCSDPTLQLHKVQ